MKTTVALLMVSVACAVNAMQQSVYLPSVGKVTLNAAKPGGWTFETRAEKAADGVDVVRLKMRAANPETPPVFEVRWRVSQKDVHHLWTSESTHYGIPWSQPMLSEISSWMPLYSFLDANDANRFTFACSESCRRVEFRAPISEKGMDFGCVFRFFTVPEAPMTEYETCVRFDARSIFYADAIGAASDWMCTAAGLEPLVAPESAFDPLYSTWYTFHQDISSDMVEEECALAAKLGMKTLITDDGWQIDLPLGNRAWGGYHFCGDWKPGRNFPDMAEHVKRVHAMGYKYMLWYSVPFVGDKSANFDRFKGKYLPVENCCAGGWVLDPRFPEVREYLIQTYEAAVRDWDLDGFKLDFIGRFTLKEGSVDPAIAENYAGRDIKAIPVAVEKLLTDVTARLKAIKPEILVEFRQSYIGPCIRKFGNMIRATDCPLSMVENRTRISRLRLTSGQTAVHSDMLEWRADETPESAARCILNSLFGVVQYSVRLKTLPERHLAMMQHWISFSQKHRTALLRGTFRPHYPAADYPLLEGESEEERVWGVYQENLTVPTGKPDRTVYIVNGANVDSVVVDFAAATQIEVFDTFGARVRTETVSAGVRRVAVPVSGYIRVAMPKPVPPPADGLRVLQAYDGRAPEPEAGYRPFTGCPAQDVKVLPISFTAASTDHRVFWDFPIACDLVKSGVLTMDVYVSDLEKLSKLTVYLRSGEGWYNAAISLPDEAKGCWTRVRLERATFTRTEGTPSGWNKIDGLRLSIARPREPRDYSATVAVANFGERVPTTGDILVVAGPTSDERLYAEQMQLALRELAVDSAVAEGDELSEALLANRKLVILPLNTTLPTSAIEALRGYLSKGGKAIVSACGMNASILDTMGVKRVGAWFAKHEKGAFRLSGLLKGEGLPTLPERVGQKSWQTEKLVLTGEGTIAARWTDQAGVDSGIPAVLSTPKGFVLGHVLLREQAPRNAILKSMLQELVPEACAKIDARIAERKAFETACANWAKEQPGKAGERRLMWCHSPLGLNHDGDWETSLRELKGVGYTDLIANLVWGDGADYVSKVAPSTRVVAKHGDMLEACKSACRKHGVKLHVWLVCWPMARGIDPKYAEELNRQGRLQYDAKGKRVDTNDTSWLCPSSEENRNLLADMMFELAERGVDGVHFDYIRYPGDEGCYCENCRKRFEAKSGKVCANWPKDVLRGGSLREDWTRFRVANITALVKCVGEEVHARFPKVEVSAAVFRDPEQDPKSVGQDWGDWLAKGYVDFVCPMDYTWSLTRFRESIRLQKSCVGSARVFPGIGLTSSARWPRDGGDALRFTEQVQCLRDEGFAGFTCFNYDPRTLGVMKTAREGTLRSTKD